MKKLTHPKQLFIALVGALLLASCSSMSNWKSNWSSQQTEPVESDPVMLPAPEAAPKMQVINITAAEEAPDKQQQMAVEYPANQQIEDNFGSIAPGQLRYSNGQGVYNGRIVSKHIGDYVQSMTQDLISNMEYVTDKTAIGVTNFALIDSNLQQTNLLGYQISESFVHELHKFRVPIIDYKATEYIRVTEQGDFFLSRDFLELSRTAPIEYILTGTMTKHQGGYIVNARVLGIKSKAVVATAQALIPFYVVDALIPSEQDMADGVKLTQG